MKKKSDSKFFIVISIYVSIVLLSLWLSVPRTPKHHYDQRGLASAQKAAAFKDRRIQRIAQKLSPFDLRKVHLNFQAMKATSAVFAQMNEKNDFENDPWQIPQGQKLMAVIDRDCVRQPSMAAQISSDSFSRNLVARAYNRSGLKAQAFSFELDRDMSVAEIEDLAENDPCLIGLSEDGVVSAGQARIYNDPSTNKQNHLENIKANDIAKFFYSSSLEHSEGVILAVIDTGVDYKHIDLVEHVYTDNQGRHGFDFVNQDNDPLDDNFHGTHVAGLAAAVGGNDVGGSGVMPANIKIMAVKILDDEGNGSYADVANAIRYAVENGADLINLSLSGPGKNIGVEDALTFATNNGVPVFISAGNNGVELNDSTNFRTPTCFGQAMDGVMTVGSIDAVTSLKSDFSNFNPEFVEIGSPGSNGIFSTLPDNAFGELDGTSMSTPVVAGAAALIIAALKAKNIAYTAAEIEEIIRDSATVNPDLESSFAGGRQLNLNNIKDYLKKNTLVLSDGGIND